MVHFTLLCARGSAAGAALRTGLVQFLLRGDAPSRLTDLEAAHSSRGCSMMVCVPIQAPADPQSPRWACPADAPREPALQRCCLVGGQGKGAPLGVLSIGIQEDMQINAFAKFRCAAPSCVCCVCWNSSFCIPHPTPPAFLMQSTTCMILVCLWQVGAGARGAGRLPGGVLAAPLRSCGGHCGQPDSRTLRAAVQLPCARRKRARCPCCC